MRDPYTGEPADLLFTAHDNRGLPGSFPYYRSASGHVFIGDVPENLGDYYAAGYQPIPTTEVELAELAEGDAYRLNAIKARVPAGTFLEIGPWIGLVAYSAHKAGYRVSVLERSAECCRLLTSVGIDATQTEDPASALAQSGATYDAIGLWHSIEHLPRPWEVIEAAARALNPGGILCVAAPNPESAQMRALGPHWYHLDAPRHIHFLPAKLVEEIGRRNGLTTVELTTDDPLGRILDRAGWSFEAKRRARRIPVVGQLLRRPLRLWLARKHRRPGALDGAGYTLVMMRPPAA